MAQQGGPRTQRTNTQAKPVSGPGALSQRTDMVNSDPNVYGDRKETQEIMSGAPMAKAQPVPTPPPVVGLFDPTQNPNEPVTTGNPMGEGAGPEILNLPARTFNPSQILTRLSQSDPSGEVEMVLREMQSKGIF
jgi:hypothetical protein